jgi:hypothetical protein
MHGLAQWSLHVRCYQNLKTNLKMPRACPVESSRLKLYSSERESPRDKPVASLVMHPLVILTVINSFIRIDTQTALIGALVSDLFV